VGSWPLEALEARLDGASGSLGWWKEPVPIAGCGTWWSLRSTPFHSIWCFVDKLQAGEGWKVYGNGCYLFSGVSDGDSHWWWTVPVTDGHMRITMFWVVSKPVSRHWRQSLSIITSSLSRLLCKGHEFDEVARWLGKLARKKKNKKRKPTNRCSFSCAKSLYGVFHALTSIFVLVEASCLLFGYT